MDRYWLGDRGLASVEIAVVIKRNERQPIKGVRSIRGSPSRRPCAMWTGYEAVWAGYEAKRRRSGSGPKESTAE